MKIKRLIDSTYVRFNHESLQLKNLSLTFVLVVIASLNAILLWGAGTTGGVVGSNATFGILVLVMDVSLVVSSLSLGYLFWREHRVIWATLFSTNLLIMVAALVLKLSGTTLSSFVLFGADVYWLNLYLACLCCEWRWFKSSPNNSSGPATPAPEFNG